MHISISVVTDVDKYFQGYMSYFCWFSSHITHWRRVPHTCVTKSTTVGSDNGLAPTRRQAINWTNAGILLIGALGTKFDEILIESHTFSFKKMQLKMSANWRSFCLGLSVLTDVQRCIDDEKEVKHHASAESWHNSNFVYGQTSNISRTKSQHLNDSRLVLQLSLPNQLKPNVKSRMKM